MDQNTKPIAIACAAKVLITGAYATGKTTLCQMLMDEMSRESIPNKLVTEVPRRCPFALNRDQTPLASVWLVCEQIRSEIESSVDTAVLLCDRGLPDILSHTLVLDLSAPDNQALWQGLLALGQRWCATYDVVLWVRIDPARQIERDEIRVVDRTYQSQLERAIQDVFRLLGIHPIELPQETSDRAVACLSIIRDLLVQKETLS